MHQIIGLGVILFSALSVFGDVITFTDRSSWNDSAGNLTNLTFAGSAGNGILSTVGVGGLSFDPLGTTYGLTNNYLFLGASGDITPGQTPLFSACGNSQLENCTIAIVLPQGITAFGLDIASPATSGSRADINLVTNGFFQVPIPDHGTAFFGVVSDTPLTGTIYVDATARVGFPFGIQNPSFGVPEAVPEPTTALLVASGLIALAGKRKLSVQPRGKLGAARR